MKQQLKLILGILFFPLFGYSESDLIQFFLDKETMIQVRDVNSNDILNLREKATSKSKIVATIPYNAITLDVSVEKDYS